MSHGPKLKPVLGKLIHLFQKSPITPITIGELELAQQIQEHLLPHHFPFPHKIEVGTFYKPSKYIGGDFYDVIQIDDRKVAFIIGDVSGNSIPAALFMTQTLTLLKAFIKMDLSLLKILEKTNQILMDIAKPNMFATVFISIFDTYYNQLSYVNAGHNPPLLIRNSLTLTTPDYHPLTMLTAEGIALNCIKPIILEEKRIQLYSGDTLLLYTDGLIEVPNVHGEIFGEAKLKGLMTELRGFPAPEIAQKINTHLETYMQYALNLPMDVKDDMAAVVIKFKEDEKS
ncbi:MAG: hypothetical protein A2Z91_07190 [Deltaproteobacteria bacterium GWA2_38_16]|nr:MAG: hypothetical protein A2Z91_07190 [Deltaproteobacteria bacterium GWA2_38_16]OGQ02694.1 MAG: hypothetical protein A3D19_00525 [Deltaproteobacteria bacterium RIFCSPHIGHO2_02_FULL_38_15]OGQ32566.1 MAG: hypothetical protein A3A72_02880 [Deltaproteobacteria bacterium RIFCSPLOWO2_01_FULL_38_9]OGQ59038.1 MAG: hypothetical protein A3G92_05055 [Deltaproteobacteria bacterium RIFCSPLOWO2_12_FULL_38_8]HBQ20551.1 hypothetical protein [Deltaproteobacteria bacterium]